jgi:uncharacterized phage-associated protein
MARAEGNTFDQMQLQELVYIAHGWCLAITGEPLTGDRPEALEHGPEYRRIADALARWGVEPVTAEITHAQAGLDYSKADAILPCKGELSLAERDILTRIYAEYGALHTSQLATLTRVEGTPWSEVFRRGAGNRRDIPHDLIRAQFAKLTAKHDR